MDDRYLVVFPRGFIGRANTGLNKETNNSSMADKIEAVRYNNMSSREQTSEVYNLNVTEMYQRMINQQLSTCKVTFVRAVIVEAYRNFSDRDFADFLSLQRDSRYFTRQHQEFIIDTLRFILTGKREVNVNTWAVLLRRKLIDSTQSASSNPRYNKAVGEFFTATASDGKPLGGSMHRVIAQWMGHRNGHEDLLQTLNILFGKEYNK
jgi:hypothetical protein